MTTSKLMSISASAIMAFGVFGMNAAEVDFSYTYGSQDFEEIGTGKTETYDIAIRLNDASLVGSKIKSFNVPFIVSDNVSAISVWATKELKLEKKVNIPDITSVDVETADGEINVTFPEMIEIPEGGLYVGYTFTVDKKDAETEKPIVIAGDPLEDGLYMHTSRTYLKWKSYASTMRGSSAITVTLDGDFQANALGVVSLEEPFGSLGEEINLAATLVNHGIEPSLSSLEYVVHGIGDDTPLSYSFSEPVNLDFGQTFQVKLPFVAPIIRNEYPIDLEITKVNGVENKDRDNIGSTVLLVLDEVPVHKPLMEEYTGTWCQYCTRGFAGLERMNSLYPDDFVAISYHNADPMERIDESSYPNYIQGFPSAYIDRTYSTDAYFGNSDSGFGIEPFWKSIQEQLTLAVVNGSAVEKEDGSIDVKSDISFVKSVNGSYKVFYAIVSNGLTDPDWSQINAYSGANPDLFVPEMEKFCRGGRTIKGLVFDDVFAAGSNLYGEDSSLIEDVVMDQLYTHEFSFAADEGMSTSDYNLFSNASDLYAVIVLLDEKGTVVNTNKVLVENHKKTTGVSSLGTDGVVATEYFDLNGLRVDNPSNGVFVKVSTMENGQKVTSKIVEK